MAIIDINPDTKDKTQALVDCTVRILDGDSHLDYKLDHGLNYSAGDNNRSEHPYIKEYLGNTDKIDEQQIVILNKDGSERLGPIKIPGGKLAVFRLRTRQDRNGVHKFIVVGIVDHESQELHFLDIHGNETVETNPPEGGPTGKIILLPEELERL